MDKRISVREANKDLLSEVKILSSPGIGSLRHFMERDPISLDGVANSMELDPIYGIAESVIK